MTGSFQRSIDPPKVFIDLEKIRHINTGLGRYSWYLGHELLRIAPGRFTPVLFLPRGAEARFEEGNCERIEAVAWRKEAFQRLVRPLLTPLLGHSRSCLWHATHQAAKYLPLDARIPLALTIHDLNFLHDESTDTAKRSMTFRQRRKLASVQRLVDRSSAVITVSQYVADECKAYLRLEKRPVYVVPSGLSPPPNAAPQRPSFLPSGPFVLTVGNCLRHKNFHVLLDLMEHLPGVRLVIAGKKATPYGEGIERDIVRRRLCGRVIMPGEVSDGERQWLYEQCQAFLFPSLAEGFGFPVLEAMQCGKPVFMSRRTSLPEIAGSRGFFFDSYEGRSMAEAFTNGMRRFKEDPSQPDMCREHAAGFSWRRTAEAYADIYEKILRRDG